jgi:hypothetical protein
MYISPSVLVISLVLIFSTSTSAQRENDSGAIWTQKLDVCDFGDKGTVRSEGVAAISSSQVAAYCVTTNPQTLPELKARNEETSSSPYQVLVLFLDATDGHVLQKASWPAIVNTQTDVFYVNDHQFLLVAANMVQLIDRTTLATVHRLALPVPERGCERWTVVGSADGSSFGTSYNCEANDLFTGHIVVYRTTSFEKITSWVSEGRNFYDVYGDSISRWSSAHNDRDIILHLPGVPDETLRGVGYIMTRSIFVDENSILCCRGKSELRVIGITGQEKAYINLDPKHNLDNSKMAAARLFVSKTGQRIAALIFRIPWAGPWRWSCDVYDRNLRVVFSVDVATFRRGLTAALSPDGKCLFLLRDNALHAYLIPRS